MSLCTRLLRTLPTQLQQIGKIKQKSLPHSSVRYQFNSNLVSQRFFTTGACSCATSTSISDRKITASNRYESCFTNSTLRLAQLPSLHRNHLIAYYSSNATEPEKKLSLFQRFKKMYKEYGYVLVPVHLVTSAIWFTSFYYITKSLFIYFKMCEPEGSSNGIDIASVLESIGVGETLVQKLRNTNSTMGYLTVSLALYKIATPLRYTVTLGGTTLSIKYLRDWGYIKPIPPKDKLKEIMHDKKDKFLQRKENLKRRFRGRRLMKKASLKMGLKKN